ncbi:efflux RND transporter permease subunit [Pseudolysobacter antarcticus]|uniref:Efflux RND transporter permease subunit n=1 Tax=Pseudolysobacter antarcticus TaxID=2511995 RepID=A0A411HJB5_9GAMM|nr:efflux RND transporter permease subunit [Pseudolysobacter antarcticus]QBB70588.1 efflux RND transporter permease subunit [Pseudolysobacter antarcticus]
MSIVAFATRRRVTIGMVTLTLVLFGFIALGNLKVNLLPDLSYPTLTVRTEYEGAAPLEIESLISQPVEEAIGVVKNVRKIHSVSRTGQSDVILEFSWGTNMELASLEVRDKLEVLSLPLESKKPVLLRFNPSTDPIIRLGLTGDSKKPALNEAELKQLRRFADDELKKRLEPTIGVAAIKVGGGLEDEIDIDIDQQRLQQVNLTVNDVANRLRDENVNVSGGRIDEGTQRYLVRTVNQFTKLDEMRDLLVKVDKGVPVRLRDVAEVRQGYKEREGIVRIDGREAIEMAVYKEGDANTVSVATAVKAALEKLKPTLPANAELALIDDQSIFIEHSLDDVRFDAMLGGVLAILIIFFFLSDTWSTFIISLSLPVSLITTFFFMDRAGLSLNVMSLGGLALATGMVVDDSIVVLENVARMRERGMSVIAASIKGAAEVAMAVTASTLTTVAVFFPLVFVQGIAGQLFRDQALTVTFAMLISLVVAMTLIPMLASLKGRAPLAFKDEVPRDKSLWEEGRIFGLWLLLWPFGNSKFRNVVLAFFLWLVSLPVKPFIFIFGWGFGLQLLKWPFGESWAKNPIVAFSVWAITFAIKLVIAPFWAIFLAVMCILSPILYYLLRGSVLVGRPVARWIGHGMRFIGRILVLIPYEWMASGYRRFLPGALKQPLLVLGFAAAMFGVAVLLLPTLGMDLIPQLAQGRFEMVVKLPPGTPLAETDALVRELQLKNAKDPNIKSIYGVSGTGTRLDANPTDSGENIGRLLVTLKPDAGERGERAAMDGLRKTMAMHAGVEVKFSRPALFSLATPLEIEIRGYDLSALEKAGHKLTQLLTDSPRFADVKSTVEGGYPEVQIQFDQDRAAALGLTSKQIADQVVNKVKGSVATRYSFKDRKIDVLVRNSQDNRRSVADIKNLIVNVGTDKLVRLDAVAKVVSTVGPSEIHRITQERVAIISANLHYGDLGTAVKEVQSLLAANPLAAGVSIHIGGQSEELDASVNSLIFALSLAIFLVYLVMASQFESLLHPFVIMFSIPLALVGAVLALKITHTPLSVVVFIGLIMLAGIVVKNAIILIDRVNQLRESGTEKVQAIMLAAESRLRPITMTTMCTLLGFLPLAISTGDGSEVRAPMAIAVMGGLAVSTLLTLIVIPVLYNLLDRKPDSLYLERGRRRESNIAQGDHDSGPAVIEGAV